MRRTSWRYWLLGAVKLTAYAAAGAGALRLVLRLLRLDLIAPTLAGTTLAVAAFLTGFVVVPAAYASLGWLLWRDQRYRCRVCARRLRMPVALGSPGAVLLDPYAEELICPYGHGKLYRRRWFISKPPPEWTRYGDMWEELFPKSRR